jgi:RNA ligase (TIGR02306 family)
MNETLNEIEANEITERDSLAVVYRVESLEPIPLKDRIELVHLKDCGYTCVCEKGHKVGDFVVFVKYDTIVPNNELFEFMKEFKFRVKPKSFTERDEFDNILKKIYSQGIVLPIKKVYDFLVKDIPEEWIEDRSGISSNLCWEGYDMTETLGIKKYIPPTIGGGSSFGQMCRKGDFPTHIVPKTDEMNLASKMRALEEIQGQRVYITLKIEGSSLTTMWDDGRDELMVCSRNNQIGEHETNKFWQAVNKYNLKDKFAEHKGFINFAIQAELYGSGVQKNKLAIEGADLAAFNVIERVTKKPLCYDDLVFTLEWMKVPMVPLVMVVENFNMTFDELQALADSQKYASGELAEGIVIRPCTPFWSNVLKSYWSVKVINRDYKL